MVIVTGFGSKGLEFKFYESNIDIRQDGHRNLKLISFFNLGSFCTNFKSFFILIVFERLLLPVAPYLKRCSSKKSGLKTSV